MFSTNLEEWCKLLPGRPGWGQWEPVSGDPRDGVQCWAERESSDAAGVIGVASVDHLGRGYVGYTVYSGDCRGEPKARGFSSAEGAMSWAEDRFPEQFDDGSPRILPQEEGRRAGEAW